MCQQLPERAVVTVIYEELMKLDSDRLTKLTVI